MTVAAAVMVARNDRPGSCSSEITVVVDCD